ncbi:MAG: hypothetical protein ACKO2P_01145 [Planctomycetota bacterium]
MRLNFTATHRLSLRPLLSTALLLSLVLTAAPAWAQKGNQPGRGGQAGNKPGGGMKDGGNDRKDYELAALLPTGYQHLRTAEVRQLEQLVLSALGWLRETAPLNSGFQHPADLFQPSADVSDMSSIEVRGLWILSLLNLDQRKTLATIPDESRSLSASRNESVERLTELLGTVRSHESPATLRKLETDSRRLIQEIAGIDTELGTLQVRLFLRIARSIPKQQSEEILLAIGGPGVPEAATPEMQTVRTELQKTSADAARDLEQLGVSFAAWLAPSGAARTAQSLPANDAERRGGGGGRDKTVDPAVIEFLTALRGPQQDLLLQLLATSVRHQSEAIAATTALQMALRTGSAGRVPEERIVRGLALQRTQAVFTAAADDVRGFEALRRTLSDAQKKHLRIEQINKPKTQKSSGD